MTTLLNKHSVIIKWTNNFGAGIWALHGIYHKIYLQSDNNVDTKIRNSLNII